MFCQSFFLATVWFVTAAKGQSSPGHSVDSSSTTTIDSTSPVITQPSPEATFSWLPVSTLYSSVNIDDSSTVTAAVIATDLVSETTAAYSTINPDLYSSIDSDGSSTVSSTVIVTDMSSETAAAASTYATSDAQNITPPTSVEAVAGSTMGGDTRQTWNLTDAAMAAMGASTTSTSLDPGVDTDTISSAPLSSTFNTVPSSPVPGSTPTSSSTPAPMPPSSTDIPAAPASSLMSQDPPTVTQIITSIQPTTIISIQPTTVLSTPATTLATSVVVASTSMIQAGMDCPKHSKDCHKEPKRGSIICNTTGDKKKPLLTCDSYSEGNTWELQNCWSNCSCEDGALACQGFPDTACNTTAVTSACDCHWNIDTQACDSGTTNNWKLGGCACPPTGQDWS